jgi:hypothetical protein
MRLRDGSDRPCGLVDEEKSDLGPKIQDPTVVDGRGTALPYFRG